MSSENQPTDSLKDVQDIRRMMERSSRFLSLSGFSGIAAGICALIGAFVAYKLIDGEFGFYANTRGPLIMDPANLEFRLILTAVIVFLAALGTAFWFTWRRSSREGTSLWNITSRKLFWNMAIPITAGGVFILALMMHGWWAVIAPSCLIFYGMALLNASKYTLTDIRYLAYCEIVLGLINMWWIGYGLYFWAVGFGVLHIVYGIVMWYKYERKG